MLGSFLAQLGATVVNVSLSSLAVALHSSLTAIHWVTSGYLLALALMLGRVTHWAWLCGTGDERRRGKCAP